MATVRVEQVSVRRGSTQLLAPVTFELETGAALFLTGANGAGKTTLLRVLAGLTRPSSGAASVGGSIVDERDPLFRRRVAALIGSVPFAATMTSREHLTAVGISWGAGRRAAELAADELLSRLGLDALGSRFPHELSSGQHQLMSLAVVLARPSEVLVLDEPEQRLDEERRALLAELLAAERARGSTLVIATHSRALREAVGGRELQLAPQTGHGDEDTERGRAAA